MICLITVTNRTNQKKGREKKTETRAIEGKKEAKNLKTYLEAKLMSKICE